MLWKLEHADLENGETSIDSIMRTVGVMNEKVDYVMDKFIVSILIMRRAKGLSVETDIVAATKD